MKLSEITIAEYRPVPDRAMLKDGYYLQKKGKDEWHTSFFYITRLMDDDVELAYARINRDQLQGGQLSSDQWSFWLPGHNIGNPLPSKKSKGQGDFKAFTAWVWEQFSKTLA